MKTRMRQNVPRGAAAPSPGSMTGAFSTVTTIVVEGVTHQVRTTSLPNELPFQTKRRHQAAVAALRSALGVD